MITTLSQGPQLSATRLRGDRVLISWMILLIITRLWLSECHDFLATYTTHDDYLFIRSAKYILSGEWLGPFDQVTLIKGPIYPLFIAAVHHTGIPLLFAQQLLYSLFCVFAIVAIRPLCEQRWPFMVIFFLLLFNPFMYLYPASGRAFRLGLSMPLVLALFSTMIGLLLRAHHSLKTLVVWGSLLGIIFSLLWFTREEGIWLLPSLALFAFYFLFINNELSFVNIVKRISILLLIPVIFLTVKGRLTYLNNIRYGVPVVIELKSPEFQAALGGLMKIDDGRSKRYVPVSKTILNAAFVVSPTLRKLQPYFEDAASGPQRPKPFFIWIFRDIVKKSGNTETLPQALHFYGNVGKELEAACKTGELKCLDRSPSIKPVWENGYNKLVPEFFWKILNQAVTFNFFTSDVYEYTKWNTTATAEMVKDYQFVTREKLVPGRLHEIRSYPDYYAHMIIEKNRVLIDIAGGFKIVVPYLFAISLLSNFIFLSRSLVSKTGLFEAISGLIILSGILSLVSVLTYVKITLWPINRPLFSAYPLVLLYISTMLLFLYSFIRNNLYKKLHSNLPT